MARASRAAASVLLGAFVLLALAHVLAGPGAQAAPAAEPRRAADKVLERTPAINMAGMKNALDDLAKTVPAAKDAKPEQFIDMGYLDRLEKSGILKELYR